MSRLLSLTAASIVCLSLGLIGVRVVGWWVGPPAAVVMLDPGACKQPCWHGIQPGRTVMAQISKILSAELAQSPNLHPSFDASQLCWDTASDPAWHGCVQRHWSTDWTTPVASLVLEPHALRLGDAIVLFGEPIASRLCQVARGQVAPNPQVVAHIFFKGNIYVMASRSGGSTERRFDPNMVVNWVFYYSAIEPLTDPSTPRWLGFSTSTGVCLY
jgi:hypothetical protein